MIKTFVIPHISTTAYYLLSYILGIISAHFIFEYTYSIKILAGISILITTILITFFIFKSSFSHIIFFLLCGFIRTSFVFYQYNHYTPNSNIPFKVLDITKTGNTTWSFCTKLSQTRKDGSYNMLLYTKKRPTCAVDDLCVSRLEFKKPAYTEFCRYLFKEQTIATGFSYGFKPLIIDSPTFSIHKKLYTIREKLLTGIATQCSRTTSSLFASLCLGNKKIFKKELKKPKLYFRSWGIVHHLARSGLHLIIVLFIWYLLFSIIPISYPVKTFGISTVATLFALFSFEGISFTRSLTIFFITQVLLYYNQQTNGLHLLLTVASLFLFYNPFLIFSLDFQLSFFITLLLCLFSLINRQKRVACCKLLLTDYKKA